MEIISGRADNGMLEHIEALGADKERWLEQIREHILQLMEHPLKSGGGREKQIILNSFLLGRPHVMMWHMGRSANTW